MKRNLQISILLIVIIGAVSAGIYSYRYHKSKEENVAFAISRMIGDSIIFPNMVETNNNMVLPIETILGKTEYRIISYIDTSYCYSCRLQLKNWKNYISEISATKANVQMLLVFNDAIKKEAENIIMMSQWNMPVIFDTNGEFYRNNFIPSQFEFQTFLVNENNVIIAVGNPMFNTQIKSLYNKLMGKEYIQEKITTVKILSNKISFNNLQTDSIYSKELVILNTGKERLRLLDISATCNCIETSIKDIDAEPGDSLRIEIKYKALNRKPLSEKVCIRLNTNPQTNIVKIEGKL